MRRFVSSCLPLLCLVLLWIPARAEEAEPAIDPVEVARLLLAPDEATRARGEALLLRRIEQGGDLAGFLRRMARAQAERVQEPAQAATQTLESESEEEPAGALEEAVRREFERPPDEEDATRQRAALQQEAEAPKPSTSLRVRAQARVLEVDREALGAWLDANAPPAGDRLRRGEPVVLQGSPADRALVATEGLVEARWLRSADTVELGGTLLEPEQVRWRSALRPTKSGAWAVRAGTLPRGLEVEARVLPAEEGRFGLLVVEGLRHEVPLPLPVSTVRPEAGVDPVELDRPEWEVVRLEVRVPFTSGTHAFLLPGLVEDRVIVVGLDLP